MWGKTVPDDLVACPRCKTKVPEGKFCNACGKPLDKESSESESASRAALEEIYADTEEPQFDNQSSHPDFLFSIDGMDERSMAIVFSRSELKVLDKELDRIIGEISSTRQALDLQHADKDRLIERATSLRKEFDDTKARREKLRAVEGEIPLKNTLTHLAAQKSKLEKLESAEKTLDPVIFEEEKKRLQIRIKNLTNDLKEALKTSKKWTKSMDSEIKRIQRALSRLDAKLKIGDVSQTAYDAKKVELSNSISIINGGKKTLEEMISLAEKSK